MIVYDIVLDQNIFRAQPKTFKNINRENFKSYKIVLQNRLPER